MTKSQKLWFWVGLITFLVFEIIWGVIFNALSSMVRLPLHSLYFNHRLFNDHPVYAYAIILIELVSVLSLIYIVWLAKLGRLLKGAFYLIFSLLALCLVFLLWLSYAVSHISFP